MKESLQISQAQQLTQRLSPRQLQFVRLVEMTGPEVEAEIQLQLDDNPALEAIDTSIVEDSKTEDILADNNIDIEADEDPADVISPSMLMSKADPSNWQIESEGLDLWNFLINQLGELELDDTMRYLSQYIIGNIDANGYLTRSLMAMVTDVAINTGEDITEKQMRQALDIVRRFEPAGVGAFDLRDCLLLQLRRMESTTPALKIATEIVADYFDLFSKKHYDRLQSQLGIEDSNEFRQAIELILSLNPKPGSLFEDSSMSRMSHISPDLILEEGENGRFSLSIANRIPQLQVEQSFMLDENWTPRNQGEREAQLFIKLKRDDAESFISLLQQRSTLLLKVGQAIVSRQRDFFITGERSKLRPMILKDIAADTDLDLSMISRATAGKYMATQFGCFPLKMFFNEAPQEDSEASTHQLMHALQQVIKEEDPKHPLSDEALAATLGEKGFHIARRTVTKYREKLGVPVGRLRKKI